MRMKILSFSIFIILLALARNQYYNQDLIDLAMAIIKANPSCYYALVLGLPLLTIIFGLLCREWGYKEGMRRAQIEPFLMMGEAQDHCVKETIKDINKNLNKNE